MLIFTDLDGTLLDSKTYDFSAALPALIRIHSQKIPLILVSSKTRAEMEPLHKTLSLDSPFISENGGGIFFPPSFPLPQEYPCEMVNDNRMIGIGRPITEVLEKSKSLKKHFAFKGFSEMAVSQIADLTGLTAEQATLASRREFDEPIVLEDSTADVEMFCKKASDLGLDCVEGGRFIHLFLGSSKGKAVELLLAIYKQIDGPHLSVGLGDSPNDIPMLEAVDKAVLITGAGSVSLDGFSHPDLIKAEGNGPAAWNRVVLDLLSNIS
jgi:mannosyl-3-phosphoglycerate phosphatase